MDRPCFECGQPAHHDHHVVPRSRGGTRTVPLCVRCHGLAHGVRMGTPDLTREALQRRKAAGLVAGEAPFGWSAADDGRLVENHAEQQTIRLVAAMRASGLSLRGIVHRLAELDVRGRTGRFLGKTQVARIVSKTAA